MADWYVRGSGFATGANNGTSYANAWLEWPSSAQQLASIQPGDTIWVCGVLHRRGSFVLYKAGTLEAPITVNGLCTAAGETQKAVTISSKFSDPWVSGWTAGSNGAYYRDDVSSYSQYDMLIEDTNKLWTPDNLKFVQQPPDGGWIEWKLLQVWDLECVAGSTTVTSVAGGFTARMAGTKLNIVAGTNFTPGLYTIQTYNSANSITLATSPQTNSGIASSAGNAIVDCDEAVPTANWPAGTCNCIQMNAAGTSFRWYYKPHTGTTDGNANNNRVWIGACGVWPMSHYRYRNLNFVCGTSPAYFGADSVHYENVEITDCVFRYTFGNACGIRKDCLNFLVEDCLFEYCEVAIYIEMYPRWPIVPVVNVTVRGNTIRYMRYPYTKAGHTVYIDNHSIGLQECEGALIENNDISYSGAGMICPFRSTGPQFNVIIRNNFLHDHERRTDTGFCRMYDVPTYTHAECTGDAAWNKAFIQQSADNDLYSVLNTYGNKIYNNIMVRGGGGETHGCLDWRDSFSPVDNEGLHVFNNVIAPMSAYDSTQGASTTGYAIRFLESVNGDIGGKLMNNAFYDTDPGKPFTYWSSSTPADDLSHLLIDYNLWYSRDGVTPNESWIMKASSPANWAAWQAYAISPGNTPDVNGLNVEPGFLNTSGTYADAIDFTPLWNSPLIDAGTSDFDDERTVDYYGNPIYGPPDIGAIEYQPPYTMGLDEVDTGETIRVYGDGRFRVKSPSTPDGVTAAISVIPQSANKRHYIDIEITTWALAE